MEAAGVPQSNSQSNLIYSDASSWELPQHTTRLVMLSMTSFSSDTWQKLINP